MLKKLFAVCMIFTVLSCTDNGKGVHRTIPYVNDVLSGSAPGLGLLVNKTVADRNRILYVFGDSASCEYVRDTLMAVDKFDNASGASAPDRLPDFAGELVVCMNNADGRSYGDFMSRGDTAGLRKLAVNMLLASLDTTFHLSLYDKEGLGRKKPAKVLLFTDPWVSLYGQMDIDTLLTETSCPVSVIVPVKCAFDDVLAGRIKAPCLVVVSGADSSAYPVYSGLYKSLCEEKSLPGGSCKVIAAAGDLSLQQCMDDYLAQGDSTALNAVIFDCGRVNYDVLQQERAKMTSVMYKEYVRYGYLFAEDFRFVSSLDCAALRCHRIMRSRNIFSHNIAEPASQSYWMVGDMNDMSSISVVGCIR